MTKIMRSFYVYIIPQNSQKVKTCIFGSSGVSYLPTIHRKDVISWHFLFPNMTAQTALSLS